MRKIGWLLVVLFVTSQVAYAGQCGMSKSACATKSGSKCNFSPKNVAEKEDVKAPVKK